MLSLKNITLKVGQRLLFNSDNIELKEGLIALIGRNGAGKSSLFQSLLQSFPLSNGEFLVNGQELNRLKKADLAKTIAIVFTKPEVYGDNRVEDIMVLGRIPHQGFMGKTTTDDLAIVRKITQQLNISQFLNRSFSSLSDGEKQLVMIGRAFVQDTPIILLDEPAAFLDVVNRIELIKILKELAESENKLIIFSTHHLDQIEENCDGVLLIADSKLRFLENKADFLPSIQTAFNLEQ
ncbi:MAG: ABC transporter ATP-binding protein [Crocinitomicaceae bacterium]